MSWTVGHPTVAGRVTRAEPERQLYDCVRGQTGDATALAPSHCRALLDLRRARPGSPSLHADLEALNPSARARESALATSAHRRRTGKLGFRGLLHGYERAA